MTGERKIPPPPTGVSGEGRAFWRQVHREYSLEPDELLILTEVCRLKTSIDESAAAVARDGVVTKGYKGQPVAHPAIAVMDRQRALLTRMIAALGLPHPDGSKVKTGQQVRGEIANQARWAAEQGGSNVSDMASHAAWTRWHGGGPHAS